MRILKTMCALGLGVLLSGCATMMSGGKQEIKFSSTPAGAEVSVDGKTCKTPCALKVKTQSFMKYAWISYPGYEKQQIILTPHLNGWVYANILNGGFGFLVDYISGAIYRYDKEFHVPLDRK